MKTLKTLAMGLVLALTLSAAPTVAEAKVTKKDIKKAKKVTVKKKITLKVGKTKKIKFTNKQKKIKGIKPVKWKVTFKSKKKKIATVTKKGVVKGKKAGTTKIIAKVKCKYKKIKLKKRTFTFTVKVKKNSSATVTPSTEPTVTPTTSAVTTEKQQFDLCTDLLNNLASFLKSLSDTNSIAKQLYDNVASYINEREELASLISIQTPDTQAELYKNANTADDAYIRELCNTIISCNIGGSSGKVVATDTINTLDGKSSTDVSVDTPETTTGSSVTIVTSGAVTTTSVDIPTTDTSDDAETTDPYILELKSAYQTTSDDFRSAIPLIFNGSRANDEANASALIQALDYMSLSVQSSNDETTIINMFTALNQIIEAVGADYGLVGGEIPIRTEE